ncbi:GerAB/ArcD/ProY family transporter [Domibacillus enclensis]|uniref:Spore germination protein KB n=1 Tax=Domibacillus enclensis TaxID=1017273 RepID=A0A1N6XWI6_9BACI|nr:GerAB/ArcD/ProY family transporter [Domibacillus enclensis]OXS77443.1 spore gernimation protein KB [Domibacillus enclensis]SIR06591.1 spore germination protein KB [Domibacillus enclensis]
MENAKISAYQLFVLIVLFELGSAILVPLAIDAKQEAWLAILISTLGGLCLFWLYFRLYEYYPDRSPVEYIQALLGKIPGSIIVFAYILFCLYLSARVLRDFGEMLVTVAYPETPLFIINTIMIAAAAYAVRKGIETIARTGELLFVLFSFLFISAFFLISVAGIIDVSNLRPAFENGLTPVVKTAFTQTLYFPFGEVVAFAMIFPYVNNAKEAKKAGLLAVLVSGVTLALMMASNTSVLGIELVSRSLFPLLSTIQTIEVFDFIERLDVYFMLASVIGGFFKISLFFYIAVRALAILFNEQQPIRLAYPIGMVILVLSMMTASNFSEHLTEGIKSTLFTHLPFQVVFPFLLFLLAAVKHRRKKQAGADGRDSL